IRGTEFAEITILLFSVERTENNKHHALRTFRTQKHRVAIDFFHLPASQRQMKIGNFLCVLCVSVVNIFFIEAP
ncbi:MAG: hypothetical protein OET57_04575, partial [Desulfobacteraceae bacterium]|nr:hypothetical protein [Desulfobacteraceae bacterium]